METIPNGKETNGQMTEIEMETIHDIISPDSHTIHAPTVNMFQSFASPGLGIVELSYEQSSEKSCCQIPIFLPLGRLITYWNFFLLILMIFSVVEIPYTFSFIEYSSPTDPLVIFGFIIDLCLLLDVFINFRTAYVHPYDELRIISDPKLIARRYLKSWFIIDILASTPFTYFILIAAGDDPSDSTNDLLYVFKALRILKMFRIVKLLHMSQIFRMIFFGRFYFQLNATTRRLARLGSVVLMMILTAHYVGMVAFCEIVLCLKTNPFSFQSVI